MKTNDTSLADLMKAVDSGAAQLPEFQRPWVWDDSHIRSLILSVIKDYPVGAAMFLEYGSESLQFKHHPIEGSKASADKEPSALILDGQQRLTSLYNALYSKDPVVWRNKDGKLTDARFYYLSIEKALDPDADDDDIVISVPESRVVTSAFGKNIELDLSSRDKEFSQKMFPLNLILSSDEEQRWMNDYYAWFKYDLEVIKQFSALVTRIIVPAQKYTMPVITLGADTTREAVCNVFEKVNTGGVSLTVFELVTAIFAIDGFRLREDWEARRQKYFSDELLCVVSETDFLTAVTLFSSYKAGKTVSCKKKDVLALKLSDYQECADIMCEGFKTAGRLLQEERVFSCKYLPYSSQLIPLAAICAALQDGNRINTVSVRDKVKQWYWCGVFGELYGSALESRYANDLVQVVKWVNADGVIPKTITDSFFNPVRLLGLQSRQSAAYKGIMALILKNRASDFISGMDTDFTVYFEENIDIHHVFPQNYCKDRGYGKEKWNSILNKTPLSAKSNRIIGGDAPSVYLGRLEKQYSLAPDVLDGFVSTHLIDPQKLRADDFQGFIIDRARKLLQAIEAATGKAILGKDSDEVQKAFGEPLA
jgi:hypothetical protein